MVGGGGRRVDEWGEGATGGVGGGGWVWGVGGAAECQYQITGRLSAGTHATLQAEPSVEMRIYYKLIKLSLSLSLPPLSLSVYLSPLFFLIASV